MVFENKLGKYGDALRTFIPLVAAFFFGLCVLGALLWAGRELLSRCKTQRIGLLRRNSTRGNALAQLRAGMGADDDTAPLLDGMGKSSSYVAPPSSVSAAELQHSEPKRRLEARAKYVHEQMTHAAISRDPDPQSGALKKAIESVKQALVAYASSDRGEEAAKMCQLMDTRVVRIATNLLHLLEVEKGPLDAIRALDLEEAIKLAAEPKYSATSTTPAYPGQPKSAMVPEAFLVPARDKLAQLRILELIRAEMTKGVDVLYERERDAERRALSKSDKTLGMLLADADKLASSVNQTGISFQYAQAARLAVDSKTYAQALAMQRQVACITKLRKREAEFKLGAKCQKTTHASLEAYTSDTESDDVSLASALAAATDAGVPAEMLAKPQQQLRQALNLCKIVGVCDYANLGAFPSVAGLATKPEFDAFHDALVDAVNAGVPKMEPRWLQGLAFRVMAERMNELRDETEKGRVDMACLDADTLERKYALVLELSTNVVVDEGKPTEATIHYPGVSRTDSAYLMLEKHGHGQAIHTYTRQNLLDIEAILSGIHALNTLRESDVRRANDSAHTPLQGELRDLISGSAENIEALERAVSKVRELMESGEVYGPRATQIVDAAEKTIAQMVPALRAVDDAVDAKDEAAIVDAIGAAKACGISNADLSDAEKLLDLVKIKGALAQSPSPQGVPEAGDPGEAAAAATADTIAQKLQAVREAGEGDIGDLDWRQLDLALKQAKKVDPKVPAAMLDAPMWQFKLGQAKALAALTREMGRTLEVIHGRERNAERKKLKKGEVSLSMALEEVERVSKVAQEKGHSTGLASQHPTVAIGKEMLNKARAFHKVTERIGEFKLGESCPKQTHAALTQYVSADESDDVSLAAAVTAAGAAGVSTDLLVSAVAQLAQAAALTKITAVCDYAKKAAFPSVTLLRDPDELAKFNATLVEARAVGVPDNDPRWLQALAFRVMAERMNDLAMQVVGCTDLASLHLERLEEAYELVRVPIDRIKVDADKPTEVYLDYPGLPRTDGAYRMLGRFGRSPTQKTYGSASSLLDVDTIIKSVRVVETIRNMTDVATGLDAEATVAEAREMIRVGTLFGEGAKQIVDAAASSLDEMVA